jgi:hypothetical protein
MEELKKTTRNFSLYSESPGRGLKSMPSENEAEAQVIQVQHSFMMPYILICSCNSTFRRNLLCSSVREGSTFLRKGAYISNCTAPHPWQLPSRAEIFVSGTYYIASEIIHGNILFCLLGFACSVMRDVNIMLGLQHRWLCFLWLSGFQPTGAWRPRG